MSSPAQGRIYVLGQTVGAAYGCADEAGGSGMGSCAGPVPSGSPIDTSTVGTKSFTVNASDNAGNVATTTVTYSVTYGVCPLFDQTRSSKAGSTVPVKLRLCDARGANVSAAATTVTATGLTKVGSNASVVPVSDSGNANPDSRFRYDADLAGYIYNLSTKGLTPGTWALSFTVAGDPVAHTVQFDVR